MLAVKKIVISLTAMIVIILLFTGGVYAVADRTGVVTGDVVNLRTEPNTSSKILKQLKKGTNVFVSGSEGDWYKISYSDNTGWINGNYISIRDKSISAGTVISSVVNIRSKPDISSEVLTKLDYGTKVEIYERSGVWYRISIGEDKYGWMHIDYVAIGSDKVSRGTATDAAVPVQTDAATDNKASDGTGGDAAAENDNADNKRQEIVAYAKSLLGIRYVYGGSSTKGFDCSGFVSYVFKRFDITLERASRDMGNHGIAVKKADLQLGDLVFFDTNGGLNGINHVGIYIGNRKFIHASSSINRRVTISSLDDKFYSSHYMRARDYLTK